MKFNYKPRERVDYVVTNNGHSLQVDVADAKLSLRLSSGVEYALDQFHFHWGKYDNEGSEHTIDGTQYSAELHFVHHNKKYSSLGEAMSKPDGLAVVAMLIKVGHFNPTFQHFLRAGIIHELEEAGESTTIRGFNLTPLLGTISRRHSFYRYKGSLTTPPCYESVIWTIMANPITISKRQLIQFRRLKNSHEKDLVNNFRPTQPINGREIYRHR